MTNTTEAGSGDENDPGQMHMNASNASFDVNNSEFFRQHPSKLE